MVAASVGYLLSRPLHATLHKCAALTVLALVPLLSLGIYLAIGNPQTADAPLAPRLEGALEDLPPAAILARLEQRLRQAPDDATGWVLMARLRMTIEDFAKAADAWQRLLQLEPNNDEAMVGLAQALIEQDGGVVSADAVDLLDMALVQQPNNFAALFWRAEAHAQTGETDRARRLWQKLRRDLPDNMPLARMLDQRLK